MATSKTALSGLRTVKRDWSASSKTDSDGSQDFLDARARRLRNIQAGLDEREQPTLPSTSSQHLSNLNSLHIASRSKRPPSPPIQQPAAKKRTLPSTWEQDVYTSSSNFLKTAARIPSATGSTTKTASTGVSATKAAAPSAQTDGVFLSQEQKQILRLVELGKSIFFTGSAGM